MIIRLINLAIEYFFLLLIRIYQYLLSPLLGASCRYTPTCSEYGIIALKKHGPIKDALSSMGWAWRGFGAITWPSPFQQAKCPDRKGSTYNDYENSNFTH